jgi:signal peptidase I
MSASEAQTTTASVQPTPEVAPEAVFVEERRRPVLRILAAFASSMCPGAGQWALGAGVNAVLFHLAFVGLAFAFWYGRLTSTYTGFMAAVACGWILFCLSTWDALRNNRRLVKQGSAIWLAVFLPIAVLDSTAFTNFAMRASGFRTYSIPSESMEHTLNIGDRLIVDTTYFKSHVVHAGDVIIFRRGEQQYCKRVIATAGSQVEGINGVIYVGGEPQQEKYVQHVGGALDEMNNFGPTLVPEGQLFVMGDNRDRSLDSRAREFGLVSESGLVGKPLYIYYSETPERNGRKIE